jgi:bacterioferritin-associated ferredoxin
MIICVCKNISDKELYEISIKHPEQIEELLHCKSVGADCGMCIEFAKGLLHEKITEGCGSKVDS